MILRILITGTITIGLQFAGLGQEASVLFKGKSLVGWEGKLEMFGVEKAWYKDIKIAELG